MKVVPLSNRTFPPLRLSVEPPSAEVLLVCVICSPCNDPVVFATVVFVAPTVLPTALVVPPATLPTVAAVVFATPPTVFVTPPSRPPPFRCPDPVERDELALDELIISESIAALSDRAVDRA